jgi:cytochrome b561
MQEVSRYHPVLVTLHWLLAVLIIAALGVGFFILAAMPNNDPGKIRILLVHMAVGMAILALMVIRFAARLLTARPAAAATGYPSLDRLAPLTHYGFYILVLAMVATGFATALLAGLNRSVFQRSGEPLPPDFDAYLSFIAHSYLAVLLAAFSLSTS